MTSAEFSALLDHLAAAWSRCDYATAAACFSEDVRYADPRNYAFSDRVSLRAFFEADEGADQRTDWHLKLFDETRQIGAVEYTYEGSRRYHGVALVGVKDGLITHWREYQHVDPRSFAEFTAATAGL